jgi:hypothetical protein
MRTMTLHLNDDLVQAVESKAQSSGKTVPELIESTLREIFLQRKTAKPYKLRWRTVKGESPPDVDLSDWDALIERMEGRS